jgi:NADPH-dependent 2,4-dienoyl-CoA reductase/sulfur reductase-like enzyme
LLTVKKAIVIGAGFIDLEMAENLFHLGLEVTIIDMGNQILAPIDFPIAAIVQQHIRSKGVQLKLNKAVTGFESSTNHPLKVYLKTGVQLEADVVILSIGVKPDTKLAVSAGLIGYLAQRILLQNGFNEIKNLSGRYQLWNAINAELA